jgi:hypothetical protein
MTSQLAYTAWIRRSLLVLFAFGILLEVFMRFGFTRMSHIESRITAEHRDALAIRKSGGQTKILLLGNSLALDGVVLPQLATDLGGRADCVRFVIEATEYLDWYYGLRRLFSEGSEPDVVMLCLTAKQLKSSSIRGDYSAYHLFSASDIGDIVRATGLDRTQAADTVIAHYSLFYANRNEIRQFALNRLDNPYIEMLHELVPSQPKIENKQTAPAPLTSLVLDAGRLKALRTLCSEHGARFVLLVPPGYDSGDAELRSAGSLSQTQVLIPVHDNEFTADEFQDGYHLNSTGAQIFTEKLAVRVNEYLSQMHCLSARQNI